MFRHFQAVNIYQKNYKSGKVSPNLWNKITGYNSVKTQLLEQYVLRRKCIELNTGQSILEILNTYWIIALSSSILSLSSACILFVWCNLVRRNLCCFKITSDVVKEYSFYFLVAMITIILISFLTAYTFFKKEGKLKYLIYNPSKYELTKFNKCLNK